MESRGSGFGRGSDTDSDLSDIIRNDDFPELLRH